MSENNVIDIDMCELACRIMEACVGVDRPKGMSARQVLEDMPSREAMAFIRGANAAFEFITSNIKEWGPKLVEDSMRDAAREVKN